LLQRLLVFLFVRRNAQAHARAVLDAPAGRRAAAATKRANADAASAAPALAVAAAGDAIEPGAATLPPAVPAAPLTPREALIREALAARKSREAEWNALTPAQQRRAIAGLGEGMAAIVETFRTA
jgi:hypothetical protein